MGRRPLSRVDPAVDPDGPLGPVLDRVTNLNDMFIEEVHFAYVHSF